MINELQERFQFKNKEELDAHIAMQKQAALLPPIDNGKRRRRKGISGIAARALQHYEEKYGKAPHELLVARPQTMEEQD